MIQTAHLLTVEDDSPAVINRAAGVLKNAGFYIVQSFDLRVAKAAHTNCTCPHHGSDLCDYQMIMLLIYDEENKPVTLVAHGHDGKTHVGSINDPAREDSFKVAAHLRSAFSTANSNDTE